MSKRVSAKSAKASVVVDAVGGPSSIPQEVQEAGKTLFSLPCMHTLISIHSRTFTLRPRGTRRCHRARRGHKESRPVNDILLNLSIHPEGHLPFYEGYPCSEHCCRRRSCFRDTNHRKHSRASN